MAEADLDSLAEQPAFQVWRESLAPNEPGPVRLRNWLEATFWNELGLTGDRKANGDRRAIAGSWRWSWDHRARIDSLAAGFAADGVPCGILTAAAGFVDRDRIPTPLPVYVLPTKPELRWTDGRVVVDTGVLAAGDPAQLDRQIAGLLYRNLQAEDGPSPVGEEGEAAVYGTFRIIRNEGVAAWIEDLPHTVFSTDHPRLRRVKPVPENFYQTTVRTLAVTGDRLPGLLADPAEMKLRGEDFARTVAAGGGLTQAGYGMAALIAARLGDERLQTVSRSVPDFYAAYQEAALRNGDDRPRHRRPGPPALGGPGAVPAGSLRQSDGPAAAPRRGLLTAAARPPTHRGRARRARPRRRLDARGAALLLPAGEHRLDVHRDAVQLAQRRLQLRRHAAVLA